MPCRILLSSLLLILVTGCASQAAKNFGFSNSDTSADISSASMLNLNGDDLSEDAVIISEVIIKKPKKSNASLISRLREDFSWNHLYANRKRVQYELSLMRDNQKYVDKTFSGAKKYLHFVADRVKSNNIPVELAFLPGVESQYNPLAYSFAHAAGMWQIIPSTGEILGLELNWWRDERRDLVKSTRAAIDYLTSMHTRFKGDWLLALAAYNAGPLRVEKAVKRNKKAGKPTDYWSLKLPRETTRYVPRLIALLELASSPEKYGVKIPFIADKQVFTPIKTNKQLDLNRLSVATGYPLAELISFNGGLNQRFTDPFSTYELQVPVGLESKVRSYLDSDASNADEYWISYKTGRKETLAKVATKFATKADRLAEINKLSKSTTLKEKQFLLVPIESEKLASYSQYHDANPDKVLVKRGRSERYRLRSGDSLWKISKKFKVPIKDLMRWNNITKKTRLYAGKNIYIKRASYYEKEEPIKLKSSLEHKLLSKVYYPVRKGDTLLSIANRFAVKRNDILAWNPKIRNGVLKAKKTIILHVDVTRTY